MGRSVVTKLARGIPAVVERGTGAEEALASGGAACPAPQSAPTIRMSSPGPPPVARGCPPAARRLAGLALAARPLLRGWEQTASGIRRWRDAVTLPQENRAAPDWLAAPGSGRRRPARLPSRWSLASPPSWRRAR